MSSEIREILAGITETYQMPVRIGSRCESNIFYRVEDLKHDELEIICDYLSTRISEVCAPTKPDFIVNLTSSLTKFPDLLAETLGVPEVINYQQLTGGNGVTQRLKNSQVLLVNEVITTARSCLEAHTQATMLGAQVVSWATLIDRTFGPGPVPVVAAFTGEPVRLLEKLA